MSAARPLRALCGCRRAGERGERSGRGPPGSTGGAPSADRPQGFPAGTEPRARGSHGHRRERVGEQTRALSAACSSGVGCCSSPPAAHPPGNAVPAGRWGTGPPTAHTEQCCARSACLQVSMSAGTMGPGSSVGHRTQLPPAQHCAVRCRAPAARGCCLRVFCGRALGHVVPRGAAAWGRKSPSVAPAASDTPSRFWRADAGFAPQRCVWARAEHSARVGLREAVRAQPWLRAHRRPRASCSSSAALA